MNANRPQKRPPRVVPNTSVRASASPLRLRGDGGAQSEAPSGPNPAGAGVGPLRLTSTATWGPCPPFGQFPTRTFQRPIVGKRKVPFHTPRVTCRTATRVIRRAGETASTRRRRPGASASTRPRAPSAYARSTTWTGLPTRTAEALTSRCTAKPPSDEGAASTRTSAASATRTPSRIGQDDTTVPWPRNLSPRRATLRAPPPPPGRSRSPSSAGARRAPR